MGKLVRDTIPAIMHAHGQHARTRTLSSEEYTHELKRKLREEVEEYLEKPSTEELADILEVLYHLDTPENIETARKKKHAERGGFAKRIYLEQP